MKASFINASQFAETIIHGDIATRKRGDITWHIRLLLYTQLFLNL